MNKLIQLKDSLGNLLFPKSAIDITDEFTSDFKKSLLKAVYYPDSKKVEIVFNIEDIFIGSGWVTIFKTNNTLYFSPNVFYDTCYSSANRRTGIYVTDNGECKFFRNDDQYTMSSGNIYWYGLSINWD